jgi:hypothetical protein
MQAHRTTARLAALEAYVGLPEERTGMTITARLEAQHGLLLALRSDYTDLRAEMERRFTHVETRLTALEDGMGKVLWGMTEIKNLLSASGPS